MRYQAERAEDSWLEELARDAFERIPRDAKSKIETACESVKFSPNPYLGFSGKEAAAFIGKLTIGRAPMIYCLCPHLYERDDGGRASHKAIMGIIVHEFGHAFDCALNPDRDSKDPDAEAQADKVARSWGFADELRARDSELPRTA